MGLLGAFVGGSTIGLFLFPAQLAANAQARQCPAGQIVLFWEVRRYFQ
jgi:hypothetical protein